jgi:GAF domain-containing protein
MAEQVIPPALWNALCRHVAGLSWVAGATPDVVFARADAAAEALTGRAYATILRLDEGCVSMRLFSSVPATYAVGVAKPLGPSPWRDQVVDRAEPFFAATPAAIAEHFPDPEVVASLGGRCLTNIPILDAQGRCIGLFNVAGAQAFSASELRMLQLIGQMLGPTVTATVA